MCSPIVYLPYLASLFSCCTLPDKLEVCKCSCIFCPFNLDHYFRYSSSDGYDGSAADIWSCGVILYVLMANYLPANYLPFEGNDLHTLYEKVLTLFLVCNALIFMSQNY
jgi:serine/threonine protein kinase